MLEVMDLQSKKQIKTHKPFMVGTLSTLSTCQTKSCKTLEVIQNSMAMKII